MDEKTTLTAKPAFVISLKSVTIAFMEIGVAVAFNAEFICICKTAAKVLYRKRFDKKTNHKKI